jgi:hypothetical protein
VVVKRVQANPVTKLEIPLDSDKITLVSQLKDAVRKADDSIPQDQQVVLLMKGKALEDGQTLPQVGINGDWEEVFCVLRPKKEVSVTRVSDNAKFLTSWDGKKLVSDLKKEVEKVFRPAQDQQVVLIFEGKELQDDQTLPEAGIKGQGEKVFCVLKPKLQ